MVSEEKQRMNWFVRIDWWINENTVLLIFEWVDTANRGIKRKIKPKTKLKKNNFKNDK